METLPVSPKDDETHGACCWFERIYDWAMSFGRYTDLSSICESMQGATFFSPHLSDSLAFRRFKIGKFAHNL